MEKNSIAVHKFLYFMVYPLKIHDESIVLEKVKLNVSMILAHDGSYFSD